MKKDVPEDLIEYRQLTIADFKSEDVPGVVSQDNEAYILLSIRFHPDAKVETVKLAASDGTPKFRAFVKKIRFRAVMDRAQSWWNVQWEADESVLEHEQIHFALAELTARDYNRRAGELTEELHAEGDTREEAIKEFNTKAQELSNRVKRDALVHQRKFDREIFMSNNSPSKQKFLGTKSEFPCNIEKM